MTKVGAYEAKSHFAELLKRTERGETILITRHGKPIARLVPVADATREELTQAIGRLKTLRRGRGRISYDELRSWIHEGHKH